MQAYVLSNCAVMWFDVEEIPRVREVATRTSFILQVYFVFSLWKYHCSQYFAENTIQLSSKMLVISCFPSCFSHTHCTHNDPRPPPVNQPKIAVDTKSLPRGWTACGRGYIAVLRLSFQATNHRTLGRRSYKMVCHHPITEHLVCHHFRQPITDQLHEASFFQPIIAKRLLNGFRG